MDKASHSIRSHLFTVRVWEEEIGQDQTEWRGKVQLASGGEAHYFRKWSMLVPLLNMMLRGSEIERVDETSKTDEEQE